MGFFLKAVNYTLNKVRTKISKPSTIYAYVDDIVIGTQTVEEHQRVLHILFTELLADGWTLDASKCKLCVPSIAFLGVHISNKGIEADAQILHKLEDLPVPTCAQDLIAFYGLCLGLVPFSIQISKQISTLKPYTKAPPAVFATARFQHLWATLIPSLTAKLWRPTYFDAHSTAPLTVYVDSSTLAHGAVLVQGDNLVAIWSTLNNQSYASSGQSELTGFCKVVTAFQAYLVDRPFHIFTDNRAVLAAFSPSNQSAFVLRHIHTLQDLFCYPLSIKHLAGKQNVLVDILSRHQYLTRRRANPHQIQYPLSPNTQKLVGIHTLEAGAWKDIYAKLLDRNPKMAALRKRLEKGETVEGVRMENGYIQTLNQDEWITVLPKELKEYALKGSHDNGGHYGYKKTLLKIKRLYQWEEMNKDVEKYCKTCTTCQMTANKTKSQTLGTFTAKRPFEIVAIDFLGPLREAEGWRYILVAIYYFTCW